MSVSAAASGDVTRREATLRGLTRRNRLVAVLRVAVPALGVAAFLVLAAQIYVANMLKQYGISNIRIDRGGLSVDKPTYTGVGADGSRYVTNAAEAHSPLNNPEIINLTEASFDFSRLDQPPFHATSKTASLDTTAQTVHVPGLANVARDDGMHGTLTDVRSDVNAGTTKADGPVNITMADGTVIVAGNMFYDGATWTFGRATVTMKALPKAAAAAEPTP